MSWWAVPTLLIIGASESPSAKSAPMSSAAQPLGHVFLGKCRQSLTSIPGWPARYPPWPSVCGPRSGCLSAGGRGAWYAGCLTTAICGVARPPCRERPLWRSASRREDRIPPRNVTAGTSRPERHGRNATEGVPYSSMGATVGLSNSAQCISPAARIAAGQASSGTRYRIRSSKPIRKDLLSDSIRHTAKKERSGCQNGRNSG